MSKLVIVESVSKAKVIKGFLGDGYEVTASVGHVRDLPASKLSVDVRNNFAPKYEIVKGKEKLVADLKNMVKKSDGVLLATDPDREGEAISWHLATLLNLNLKQKNRVTFNEITRKGIETGMANPAGAPHSRPSGRLQAQPLCQPEDPPRAFRRPGAERGGAADCRQGR